MEKPDSIIKIHYLEKDLPVRDLDNPLWQKGHSVMITNYWSGDTAPSGRQLEVRLLWSDEAIYVRFEANQAEPLVVNDKPDIKNKTMGLWDRDVCEIFIAPNETDRNRYFEFEIAPTGEWIDLGIRVTPSKRETDWDYASGMESAARIENDKVVMAMKIPFNSLGNTPRVGDRWFGNLFRCVGKDPTRGYLSWQATGTAEPNFHVPSRFGAFVFVK